MYKRISFVPSVLTVAALLIAACSGPATTAAPTSAPATEPAATTPATSGGAIDCMGAKSGDELTMMYQWSGTEETRWNEILAPLVAACGIVVKPESTRDQALLDTRVQGGTPPDVAFWNVTQLTQYQDSLVAMDELGADASNYNDFFLTPGNIGGRWLGLPVKADIKTIIWYSPIVFEAKGYTVPTTWAELDALVEKMVANGDVPWSMGMESGDATGWTGSDFIQDILLVQQGPDYVNGIIAGSVPYNDAGVAEAYETYGKWATDPKYTVGGAEGTLTTPFLNAIFLPFQDPPEAMMVKQSGFAGGEVAKQFPDLQYGTDYDFFAVPGAQGLQGGADWLMAFSNKPAVKALVGYLSSELGGANWAKASFDLSPNNGANGNYVDPALIKKGEALATTQGFTSDIGDSIPGGFGSAEWAAIVNYVNGGNLQSGLDAAAKVQAAAVSGTPPTSGGAIDCMGAKSGDELTVMYQWSGTEETRWNEIIAPLVDACGIVFKPESTRDQALLDTRVQGGTPPDIVFWNVTQLTQYQDKLVDLDTLGANADNYNDFFLTPGNIDGRWLGLPVKADIKTIIWYSPIVFEAKGYEVPTTWDELDALVEEMVANGDVPWSMGMESGDATGWTGSDFIQDILLVQQGPDYVNGLIDGSIAYNDAGVVEAYETYGKWATDPKYTVGGAEGTLTTPFLSAIFLPFQDPPEAMMVKQSGFAGGEVAKQFPDLVYGTDYDFFAVPGAQGLQGGADWMMAFNDSNAVKALVTYLSSETGGANWAKASFDLSPNNGANGNYVDPALVKKGEALASTQGFTPDIGDTIPGGFGSAEWAAIVGYVNGGNLQAGLDAAAKVQAAALGTQ